MLEYQSLQFGNKIDGCNCERITSISFEKTFSFFVENETPLTVGYHITDASGNVLFDYKTDMLRNDNDYRNATLDYDFYRETSKRIALGDFFRIAPIYRTYNKPTIQERLSDVKDANTLIDVLVSCNNQKVLRLDTSYTATDDCFVRIDPFVEITLLSQQGVVRTLNCNVVNTDNCQVVNEEKYLKKGETFNYKVAVEMPTTYETTDLISYSIHTYVGIVEDSDVFQLSSILQRVELTDIADVRYRCTNSDFGFPFSDAPNSWVQCILPIKLTKPQYTQNDKIYTKSNGENVVLFSEMAKEYDGTTDYVNEEMHEMILIALSCDEVYINGERLTKSDKYEIDWDNYTTDDSGEKLARATFKMKANVNRRNSNC